MKRLILFLLFFFSASTLMAGTIDYGVLDIISHSSLALCQDSVCDCVAKRINTWLATAGLRVNKTSLTDTQWGIQQQHTIGTGGFSGMPAISSTHACKGGYGGCFFDNAAFLTLELGQDYDGGCTDCTGVSTDNSAQAINCSYYIKGCIDNSAVLTQDGFYGGYVLTPIGVKDVRDLVGGSYHHATTSIAIDEVKTYLTSLKTAGKVVIFECMYPTLDTETNTAITTLCVVISPWAKSQGMFVIDSYTYFTNTTGWENYISSDDIHLNNAGAGYVASYIEQELVKILNVGTKMY